MVKATIFEAKTSLSALVKKAQKRRDRHHHLRSQQNSSCPPRTYPARRKKAPRIHADPRLRSYRRNLRAPAKGLERRGRLRVLLDTHTLLWSFISPSSLSREARAVLAEKTVEVLVSAASAWEIATKVRLGKLPEAEELERRFVQSIHEVGYTLLAIDADTALRAGRLVAGHGDPFDRILAAQALALDIPILSKDPKLDLFAVRRIW